MFNYRSMSDVELLSAYREILIAKRRQILWRAMENHNMAEKKIPKSCRLFGQDYAVAKAGAKSRLNSKEFHSLAIPPSVRALTLRFPPRIYPADRTDPRRMRHDCGVDPDLCSGVRPLRGRRGARSDQA